MKDKQTILEMLASATTLSNEAAKLRMLAKAKQDEAEEAFSNIKNLVKDGGTTGDYLVDFLVLNHGLAYPETLPIYRELQNQVAEHFDQFILVIESKVEKEDEHHEKSRVVQHYSLARLEGNSLLFPRTKRGMHFIEFPTSKYAKYWPQDEDDAKWYLGNLRFNNLVLNIGLHNFWRAPLDTSTLEDYTGPYTNGTIYQLEIVFGDLPDLIKWYMNDEDKFLKRYYSRILGELFRCLDVETGILPE